VPELKVRDPIIFTDAALKVVVVVVPCTDNVAPELIVTIFVNVGDPPVIDDDPPDKIIAPSNVVETEVENNPFSYYIIITCSTCSNVIANS
jgi:hypothetical protein